MLRRGALGGGQAVPRALTLPSQPPPAPIIMPAPPPVVVVAAAAVALPPFEVVPVTPLAVRTLGGLVHVPEPEPKRAR
jgi:hypothetical protein